MSLSAFTQNEIEKDRLKIGLVLSGGGAKGLAHVGVLKVIDSLGIKIDYVAGTSMGAVIGGLYASGYSGVKIDSIFRVTDFDKIISDELPRASKAFYERDNSEKYAVSLPFDNFKVKLPSAISRGQNLYDLLSRLTLHVNETHEFNKLPIPFFCIATNVELGEQIVLDKGCLAQSLVASAALPSLFQPITINNQVLIDGGVTNNYPVDELRAKGMDIIIGIDVQDALLNREELLSALDVLTQINNYKTIKAMEAKSKKTDILIKPDIKDYGMVSFGEGSQIIEKGKHAALVKTKDLKALATNKLNNNIKIHTVDSLIVNSITISGMQNYTRSYVLGKLKLKPNKKISYIDFKKGINNLVATNNFDSFQYELNKTGKDNTYNLVTKLKETENNMFLKFGLHYDNLYKSAALINITKKRLLFKNDVASLDFILGDNVRYNLDYLIDKGFYWSVGVRSRFSTFDKSISAELLLQNSEVVSTGLNKIDVDFDDQTNQFYLETLFRKDFALSLGLEHKRLDITTETIAADIPNTKLVLENTNYFSAFGGLKLDTYDNKYFPKKGVYFNGDIHYYIFSSKFNENFEKFSIAKAELGYALSTTDKLSFNFKASNGFKLGDDSTQTLDFALGGYGNNLINNFIPFVGYDFLSLVGNSYIKTSAIADYEVFKKHHLTIEANWANIDTNIFKSGEWFTLPDHRGYGLGYAVETLLGPVQVKYSYSPERGQSVWFFNLGFWF